MNKEINKVISKRDELGRKSTSAVGGGAGLQWGEGHSQTGQ